jgi:hypothetical protein
MRRHHQRAVPVLYQMARYLQRAALDATALQDGEGM